MIETIAQAALPVGEQLYIKRNRISNGQGPRVCVVTGTHGDELEGQYVCYLLSSFLQQHIGELTGTVDIYPAINPLGIDSITRSVPTFDIDMNRTFPGNRDGILPEYLAAKIMEDISGADICVDIHASNIYLREMPQIRISQPTSATLLPYAKMLNVDFVWIHSAATVLESTIAHSLNAIGVKTLVVEMGVGMRITKEYAVNLFHGLLNLMSKIGLYHGKVNAVIRTPVISCEHHEVGFLNANVAGIFVPVSGLFGQYVSAGQHLGDIVDPLTGQVRQSVNAVCDGLLFTIREYPVVSPGSLLGRILEGGGLA